MAGGVRQGRGERRQVAEDGEARAVCGAKREAGRGGWQRPPGRGNRERGPVSDPGTRTPSTIDPIHSLPSCRRRCCRAAATRSWCYRSGGAS